MEQQGIKKDLKNHPAGSSKPESSDMKTQQSLKVKTKIVKKSRASIFKTKKNEGTQRIQGKQQKRENKNIVAKKERCHNGEEYVEKQISEDRQQKRTTNEKHMEKSHQGEENNEDGQNRSSSNKLLTKKSPHTQNNKEKIIESGKNKQKQKNREKHGESNKGANSRKNKYKHGGIEKIRSNERKKEKLGGLIFMCSTKTKPDCFCYRVMGVSNSKKDVVLGIKPGLKLFLYDFDLKLLYGIYKASSSGGMKLEPRAFGGSFPAQVRFKIDKDCFPLPESIFKKAIRENYNEKHKFKTELTVRQVRKLTELFRPAEIHSTLQPVPSPPKAIMRDREVFNGVRGQWSHWQRKQPVNSNNLLAHEKDHRYEWREEIPGDLFRTEKDYRACGLQGDRRNMTPPSHINPVLDPFKRYYERENHHQLGPIYRDSVPAHVEHLRTDHLYLNESEYKAYGSGVGHDHTMDPYLPPLSREEYSSSSYLVGRRALIGADNLQRRESVQDRLYSTYAADALSDYNLTQQHYHRAKPDSSPVPVSSRYSFAGPSYSYR